MMRSALRQATIQEMMPSVLRWATIHEMMRSALRQATIQAMMQSNLRQVVVEEFARRDTNRGLCPVLPEYDRGLLTSTIRCFLDEDLNICF
jgi:hypothetical protein